MSYPEVKPGYDTRLILSRLIPGQTRHTRLQLLADNGPMSKNALYCKSSPACIAAGRTRSIGTYSDNSMACLVKAKLVTVEYYYTGEQPPAWNEDLNSRDWLLHYNARHRKCSKYTITGKGELVLMGLNRGLTVTFHQDGDISDSYKG